ncbi:MAG: hypothetical protein ACRD2L_26635, partial [Terriglobia bacterium]
VRFRLSLAAALSNDAFEHPTTPRVGLATQLREFDTNRRGRRGRTREIMKPLTGHGLLAWV